MIIIQREDMQKDIKEILRQIEKLLIKIAIKKELKPNKEENQKLKQLYHKLPYIQTKLQEQITQSPQNIGLLQELKQAEQLIQQLFPQYDKK